MLHRILTLLLLLTIGLSAMAEVGEEYWEYTFRPGDSIWKIAEEYTNTVKNWAEIQKLNKIREGPDRRIPPGTRILIPVSMLKHQPAPAVIIAVSGAAGVVRANGQQEAAKEGTLLYSGDRVVTVDDQSLRVQFADKSEMQVLSNSTVVFDKLSHHKDTGMVDTRIRLNSGNVKSWVEKLRPESRYEIKTPAAVTAVRGTAFRLASTSRISRTEVTEGTVGVSAGGMEKSVKEGYGIVAEKDKPLPEPVRLLPAPALGDNLSVDKSVLHVTWNSLEGATSYRYQLSGDENFDGIIIDGTTESNVIEFKDLVPGRYYLLVRGVDQYGLEGLDDIRAYDIQQAPARKDYQWLIPVTVGAIILIL